MILPRSVVTTTEGYDRHEKVVRFENKKTGLKGFIAIHNTNLGPAAGGTRMFPYESEKQALEDVLRLSRAMTYKCALAGVPFGGGKGVIIANPQKDKTLELLESYAKEIYKLNGLLYTGEDVGISETDIIHMLKISPYFIGKPDLAGDPSPCASLSTFYSIETSVKFLCGSKKLRGKKVGVKGVGKVGKELVRLLMKEDAYVTVADIDKNAIEWIEKKYKKVQVVDSNTIHTLALDVYAPCAMGNEFNEKTVDTVKARIICGSANNQLSSRKMGDILHKKGILYIPDYVANAGGLINVVDELSRGGYNRQRVLRKIRNIKSTLMELLIYSVKLKKPTHRVADELAEQIFTPQKEHIYA